MSIRKEPIIGKELRYAWEKWRELQTVIDAFLALPDVQRALQDDVFRITEFQEPWKTEPTTLNVKMIAKGYDGNPIRDLATLASALRAMGNNTQKLLAQRGAQDGMREMTISQEYMNLLLEGITLRGSYHALEFVAPEIVQTIEGLRIHAMMAIEVNLRVTKGDLDPEAEDRLVTKTHGIYVISSHTDRNVQLPHTNMVGTDQEIWDGYSYGKGTETQKIAKRVQGAQFRRMQIREFGNQHLAAMAKSAGWRKPPGRVFTTAIASEVCTESALESGMSPTFGERQWDIGPEANPGESIDFSRGNIRNQLLRGIPLITETLLHYPTDRPAVKT